MAKTNEEEERDDPQPHIKPKIDELVNVVRKDGKLDKIEERMTKARGELGNAYQAIEKDLHGNRAAVKLVRKLLGGTTDAAYDFMRTFMHLADRFGLIPGDDLVDLAAKVDKPKDDGSDRVSGADLAPQSESNVVEHPKAKTAIDRHLDAIGKGEKPDPGPGDDSQDLVDAADEVIAEIDEQRQRDAAEFDESEGGGRPLTDAEKESGTVN